MIGKLDFEFTESTINRMVDTFVKKGAKSKSLGMTTIENSQEESWMIERLGMNVPQHEEKEEEMTENIC